MAYVQSAGVRVAVHPHTWMRRAAGNILLSDGGTFKLADFGIARMCADTLQLTQQTSVAGNWAYAAPEQGTASSSDATSATVATTDRTDVWAFAASMLHAASGRLPYETGNVFQIVAAHRDRRVPDVAGAALPYVLKELLSRCLTFDAPRRPTAFEVYNRLRDVRGQLEQDRVRVSPLSRAVCGQTTMVRQQEQLCTARSWSLAASRAQLVQHSIVRWLRICLHASQIAHAFHGHTF